MAVSAFADKSHKPTDRELREVLGTAYGPWGDLIAAVAGRIASISEVWGFTSRSSGWGLRLRHKERVILYMTPQAGRFLVSFALGEKAVAAARGLALPASLLESIDAAPRYAEGRGLRVEVSRRSEVPPLALLAQVKDEH